MYKKCKDCKKDYIEEDEEICTNCAISYEEKFGNDGYSESVLEEYGDNEFLNEKGASLIRE